MVYSHLQDGRTYKHCDLCKECVKPAWNHCKSCKACRPQDHKCSTYFNKSNNAGLTCHLCGETGHKRIECTNKVIIKEKLNIFLIFQKFVILQ